MKSAFTTDDGTRNTIQFITDDATATALRHFAVDLDAGRSGAGIAAKIIVEVVMKNPQLAKQVAELFRSSKR